MNKLAFIFDGQGAQAPGMGKDFYDAYPVFRAAFDAIDPIGRYQELCFEGTEEDLADTRNTQPCMVALELSIAALLADAGIEPAMAYGLSLGEYAALSVAGALGTRDAVELAAFRGEVMAEAAEGIDCGMAAVLGLDADGVIAACDKVADEGVGYAAPTNFNCPGQIVVSGERLAVERACEVAKELGAKRCIPLAVSGPFHTKFMQPAGEDLAAVFEDIEFGALKIPVLFNTTAAPLAEGRTIAEMLVEQVQSPIHFDDCARRMAADGIMTAVEIGCGKSLSKFVAKVDKAIETLAVFDVESFEKTKEALCG
ncbi:MAG: ACP S-malonyltransferase [Coriobacteriales bacterium]